MLSHPTHCVTVTVFCRLQSPPAFPFGCGNTCCPLTRYVFPDLYLSLLFILQVWNYSSHFANDQKLQLAFTTLKGWLWRKVSLQGWWTLPSEKCSRFSCAVGSSVTSQYDFQDREPTQVWGRVVSGDYWPKNWLPCSTSQSTTQLPGNDLCVLPSYKHF